MEVQVSFSEETYTILAKYTISDNLD